MEILPRQIRAARGLLDWHQKDLALRAGISDISVVNIEKGKTNPQPQTIDKIMRAFQLEGIVFTPSGVDLKDETVQILDGENWFLDVLDDVYFSLMDKPDAELLIECGDERRSPPDVVNRIRKIRNAGIKMRVLVEEGNTHLMAPLQEYRYIPKQYYSNYVSLIYADKFCVSAVNHTRSIIFKDNTLADTRRNIFNLLWSSLEQPKETSCEERF
jgi:transcriptional regulator with XRE-family HTH domain